MRKVIIENFKCFCKGKYEFNFENDNTTADAVCQLIFLEGKNGSGKSTFLEAIVWCLTDNNLRGNYIKPFSSSQALLINSEVKDTSFNYSASSKSSQTSVEIFYKDIFTIKRILTANNTNLTLTLMTSSMSSSSVKEEIIKDPDQIKSYLHTYFNNDLTWYIKQSFPNIFLNSSNAEKYDLLVSYSTTGGAASSSSVKLIETIKSILKEKKDDFERKNIIKKSVDDILKSSRKSEISSTKNNLTLSDIKKYLAKDPQLKEKLYRKKIRDSIEFFSSKKFFKDGNNLLKKYTVFKEYYEDYKYNTVDLTDFFKNQKEENILKYLEIREIFSSVNVPLNITYSKKEMKKIFNSLLVSFYEKNFIKCPKCAFEINLSISTHNDEKNFIISHYRKERGETPLKTPLRGGIFHYNIHSSFSFKGLYEKIKDFSSKNPSSKNPSSKDSSSKDVIFFTTENYKAFKKLEKAKKEVDNFPFDDFYNNRNHIKEYLQDEIGVVFSSTGVHTGACACTIPPNIQIEDIIAYENFCKIATLEDIEGLNTEIKELEEIYDIVLDASNTFLKNTIKSFQNKINYYLNIFETNFEVCLEIEKTKKNYNAIEMSFCRALTAEIEKEDGLPRHKKKLAREENTPLITFDNIKFLSGGEFNKLNIALTLAFGGSKILILDETLNSIDENFKEKILSTIKREKDIENVFFVTHSIIPSGWYDTVISL